VALATRRRLDHGQVPSNDRDTKPLGMRDGLLVVYCCPRHIVRGGELGIAQIWVSHNICWGQRLQLGDHIRRKGLGARWVANATKQRAPFAVLCVTTHVLGQSQYVELAEPQPNRGRATQHGRVQWSA
jgi:hypothetical protein